MLTALIIAARSGSAITTELGNMVVDHEVEAYLAAGINPLYHLAVPRVIGVTVAMVFLNLYFNYSRSKNMLGLVTCQSPLPKHLSNISLLTLCLIALRALSTRSSLIWR